MRKKVEMADQQLIASNRMITMHQKYNNNW